VTGWGQPAGHWDPSHGGACDGKRRGAIGDGRKNDDDVEAKNADAGGYYPVVYAVDWIWMRRCDRDGSAAGVKAETQPVTRGAGFFCGTRENP
jgi:hypothetical protein